METLLNLRQTAAILGISVCTAYRKAEADEIPIIRLGRTIRVRPSDLERHIESHATGPAAAPGCQEK